MARKPGPGERALIVTLPFQQPFRWAAVAGFLATRAIAGIDSFSDGRYARAVAEGTVTIEPHDEKSLQMTMPAGVDVQDFEMRARRMFDLAADPAIIDAHLSRDRLLRRLLIQHPGPRVPGGWEPFEVAVRAIVGQQISVRAATTIMHRIVEKFGRFPSPRALADADLAQLGMPRSRLAAIGTLSGAVAEDPTLLTRSTLDHSIERLTALRGIGPWTAHYIAMRALGEADAFPGSDLGLLKAAEAIGIERGKLLARAERWRPWRAYAAIALWESL